MRSCNDCLKNPKHPDKKCCFSCRQYDKECYILHFCGEDCSEWKSKIETNFDHIKNMTIEELSEFFAVDKYPNFPTSPCYVCEYDKGIYCDKPTDCTDENKAKVYQKWLESEYTTNIKKHCKTCKYWSEKIGGICMHKNHSGDFVPAYAVCDDYEL